MWNGDDYIKKQFTVSHLNTSLTLCGHMCLVWGFLASLAIILLMSHDDNLNFLVHLLIENATLFCDNPARSALILAQHEYEYFRLFRVARTHLFLKTNFSVLHMCFWWRLVKAERQAFHHSLTTWEGKQVISCTKYVRNSYLIKMLPYVTDRTDSVAALLFETVVSLCQEMTHIVIHLSTHLTVYMCTSSTVTNMNSCSVKYCSLSLGFRIM